MARSKTSPADKPSHPSSSHASSSPSHGNGHPGADQDAGSQDWFNGALAAPKKAVDSLLEMHCQWLKTAAQGNETLAAELKELQQARDPVQFMSAQFAVANQQMEVLTRQVSAVMQQLYDAQLMWLGQWDEKSEEVQAAMTPQNPSQSVLNALGRAQDDWLKVTQSWIDTIHPGGQAH